MDLLCRSKYLLNRFKKACKTSGMSYTISGKVALESDHSKAIEDLGEDKERQRIYSTQHI